MAKNSLTDRNSVTMDKPSDDQATAVDSTSSSAGGKTSPRCSPLQSRSPSPSPRRRLTNRGCPSPISGGIRHHRPHSPMTDLCPSSGPPLLLRVTKDPLQPATGSLSDIRRHAGDGPTPAQEDGEDDESVDDFPETGGGRPRAFTCPVTRAFNRKRRAKMLARPPTPTYQRDGGGGVGTAANQAPSFDFHSLEINDVVAMETTERRPSNGPSEQLEAILETQ